MRDTRTKKFTAAGISQLYLRESVTVMNKPANPKLAVALNWDKVRAPIISASGRNEIAERIIEEARRHGVVLREDPALVCLLAELELGQEIPASLYRAVAEVIAFAVQLRGEFD